MHTLLCAHPVGRHHTSCIDLLAGLEINEVVHKIIFSGCHLVELRDSNFVTLVGITQRK